MRSMGWEVVVDVFLDGENWVWVGLLRELTYQVVSVFLVSGYKILYRRTGRRAMK